MIAVVIVALFLGLRARPLSSHIRFAVIWTAKLRILAIVFLILGSALWPSEARAQTPPSRKTVMDGVYSDAQAARGKTFYATYCLRCHGAALEGVSGPRLTGDRFVEQWREGTLDPMFTFIRRNMPPRSASEATPLMDSDYLDIVTYILKVGGYPAGPNDLTPNQAGNVMVVGKNGPQPVPDGALVVTVGCLFPGNAGNWLLSSATEPARTLVSTSTSGDLTISSRLRLGTLTFRLVDLEAVPRFRPDAHEGHKMQAKGYLIRQRNAERIGLTSIEMLDSACGPPQ